MNPTPRILLNGVIVELTLATALVHLSLGGTLFLLNAAGYAALGIASVAAALAPIPAIRRLAWVPKAALAVFASVTVVAYLVVGPYFTLGWLTKGIELALITLVVADLLLEADAGRGARRPARSA